MARDYPPIHNGLADHTALLVHLLKPQFDSITVVCQGIVEQKEKVVQCFADKQVGIFRYRNLVNCNEAVMLAIQNLPPDVIILQYVPHMWGRAGVAPIISLLPIAIQLRYQIPVITFLHEICYDWSMNPKRSLLSLIHRVQLVTLAIGSRILIVTNEQRRRRLSTIWRGKVRRLPAGNVSARNKRVEEPALHAGPYITWYGTLSEGQQLEELIEAFCGVSLEIPTLRLVLVGAFDARARRISDLITRCEERGVSSRLVVEGFVEDGQLSTILSGSIANIHVNISGPSGRRGVIAAYLRSGRPLISVDGPERDPEFIHLTNVLLVPDGSKGKMEEAIRSVYYDAELGRTLGKGGKRLFREEFSDDITRARLMEIICKCLGITRSEPI